MINPYDEVPYDNYALLHTHPNRMAVLARFFGMKPAPVEKCRVLELGCGNGANIIPMAYGLPDSEFMGIDLAGRPIEQGQAIIEELGLKNITLRQLDILDFPADAGVFDYIISYGIYSWVPANVRDRILEISKQHLAAQGVAFVSYNTYPGWHLRRMVREMMEYHIDPAAEPAARMQQAKAVVQFLLDSVSDDEGYQSYLKQELKQVIKRTPATLYHDDLSPINDPVYFHQFVGHAAQYGLQYLADSDFFVALDVPLSAEMQSTLEELKTDIIRREQYLDFLRCRRFRQTLLCHGNLILDRNVDPASLDGFHFLSLSKAGVPNPSLDPGTVVEFCGERGARLSTGHPVAKAALQLLFENWPRALRFHEVLAAVHERLATLPQPVAAEFRADRQALGELLMSAYGAGLLEVLVHVPRFALESSKRPVASPLARIQLRSGNRVTSLLHTTLDIQDTLAQALLLLLDGTHDRAAIVDELCRLIESGKASLKQGGQAVRGEADTRRLIVEQLEGALSNIARIPLLVA
ncbi:MAG: class I SAM-dependent methyltransferase [Acidobacteriota bacterium]